MDLLSVEYSNTFIGPSLASPISNTHFDDETGNRTGVLELENALSTGVRLNSDVTLGAVTRWNWHSASFNGQPFELLDPYMRLSHSKLFVARSLNLAADLRISAPISEKSKTNGLVTSLASEQVFTYGIPASPFTLGLTTFIQYNFHNDNSQHDGDQLELHFSPGIEYEFSNTLLFNVNYEATMTQARFADVTATQPEGSLIEIGMIWKVTENLRFNPNIHTRTSRPLTSEAFTLGAKLNWVLL